jgi:hypothetical protein
MKLKKHPIFIVLSLLLLLSHFAFVGTSYWQQKQSIESDIEQQLHSLKQNFDAEFSSVEQTMLQTASSFANNPKIQSLFWQGKQALATRQLLKHPHNVFPCLWGRYKIQEQHRVLLVLHGLTHSLNSVSILARETSFS